jgi:tetratricopeptide (TPR) repeat protein
MTPNAKPVSPPKAISAAVLEASSLLEKDRASAEAQALAILKQAPGQADALAVLVSTRRLANDLSGARDLLKEMGDAAPGVAAMQFELGLLLHELGEVDAAIAAFSLVVESEPAHARAWRALGDALSKASRAEEAGRAYAKHIELSMPGLQRLETSAPADASQPHAFEGTLKERLKTHPTDVLALQLLGKLYLRASRHEEAERQLSRALQLAPNFTEARWTLAGTFVYRGNWKMALDAVERLLEDNPDNPEYLDVKAYSLLHLGEFEAAVGCYEALLAKHPTAENCKSYGHALKALGRVADAVAAYRQSLAIKPDYGMAYWSLAELKTFRFEPADIEAMKRALERSDLTARNRAQIHFALGRASEDAKQYGSSFEQCQQANAGVRTFVRHNADERTNFVQRNKAVFTPEFFRARAGWGCPAKDPIFIVGLPRSGSTLLEQILASHSLVEPTSELQTLEGVVRDFSIGEDGKRQRHPEFMKDLSAQQVRAAGDKYIEGTSVYRKLGRPFFVDKMPNNFSYLGMLLTCLPNAKVIDARRHPLGTGLAIFKHYFADAYSFAFDLSDIGRYYRNYVELMAHFDAVQPGRVHRLFYENMVANPEQEIRKLLEYCGLPFEEQCLRFHESTRAVLTPSSEQVRQPIFADAVELWRQYERWLGPLKSTLGDVLDRYPDVPNFPLGGPSMQWGISQPIRWSNAMRTSSG